MNEMANCNSDNITSSINNIDNNHKFCSTNDNNNNDASSRRQKARSK